MATGYSTYSANALLDAIGNATSFSVANAYMQLHTGDPGAAGTANVAAETSRKAISFGSASSGSMSSNSTVEWTNITGSEDATHFTVWDAASGGNFLWSGTVTANPYTAGDTLRYASGDITLSMTPAS